MNIFFDAEKAAHLTRCSSPDHRAEPAITTGSRETRRQYFAEHFSDLQKKTQPGGCGHLCPMVLKLEQIKHTK
jgi:hypothetical protein